MTTRTCHFKLTGRAFTKIVRDFVLDDEPDRAWRFITEGLLGEDTDEGRARVKEVALGVLSGVMTLTGDETNGVGYKKTKPDKKYLDKVRYLYAGRWRHNGKWYRPLYVITTWTAESGRYATRRCSHGPSFISDSPATRAWVQARLAFFCQNGEIAQSVKISMDDGCGAMERYVIFEPCGEPPTWLPGRNTTPQEAIDDAVAAGRFIDENTVHIAPREIESATENLIKAEDLEWEDRDEAGRLRELAYAAEDELRALELARIGEAVRAQAAGDTLPLTLLDGRVVYVPRVPFTCWAVRRSNPELCPPWKTISPEGLWMCGDDPYHSDWYLGIADADGNGVFFNKKDAYDENINRPAWDLAAKIQDELVEGGSMAAKLAEATALVTDPNPSTTPYAGLLANLSALKEQTVKATVIVNAGPFTGIVGEDVVVLPDLSPLRAGELEALANLRNTNQGGGGAVIAEQGGELCHLAIVAGGLGMTVMRVADACNTFLPGMRVALDPVRRVIVIDTED